MSVIKKQSHRETVLNKYGGKCAYCGNELNLSNLTIDHIQPLMRRMSETDLWRAGRESGKNEMANYNPCCSSCNSSKSTWSIEDWRKRIQQKTEMLLRDSSTFRQLVKFEIVEIKDTPVMFYFESFKTKKE